MSDSSLQALCMIDSWPVPSVAAAVIGPNGAVYRRGDTGSVFALASVTKLLTAVGVHLAVEEGSVLLDDAAGVLADGDKPRGASLADLLAHAGGFGPKAVILEDPGQRRIYSNGGYDLLAAAVEVGTDMPFADYLREGIFNPLAMSSTVLAGSAAFAGSSTVDDLIAFVQGIPTVLAPETIATMTSPYRHELTGVLPGYGRQDQNLWGLGPEIRGLKTPHWTGNLNSPSTWGHFGQAGTFVWVDPEHQVAAVVLTNRTFGEWAIPLWPAFSDAVLEEVR